MPKVQCMGDMRCKQVPHWITKDGVRYCLAHRPAIAGSQRIANLIKAESNFSDDDAVVSLLTDVIHWCTTHRESAMKLITEAFVHFNLETNDQFQQLPEE